MAVSQSQCEVTELLKKYKLDKDSCDQTIKDLHLDRISHFCNVGGGDRHSLALNLGIKKVDVEDINRGPGEEQEKRSAVFKKWKTMKGSEATYTELVIALLAIQHKEDAENVLELLQSSIASPPPSPNVIPPTTPGTHNVDYYESSS